MSTSKTKVHSFRPAKRGPGDEHRKRGGGPGRRARLAYLPDLNDGLPVERANTNDVERAIRAVKGC